MISLNLKSLFAKLNDECRRSLEGAIGLCVARTHYSVEIEHWLLKVLEKTDTDVAVIIKQYGIDTSRLQRDLTKRLERFKSGNTASPSLSGNVVTMAREGYVLASIEQGFTQARTGHLFAAMLADDSLSQLVGMMSTEFEKLDKDKVRKDLPMLLGSSMETGGTAPAAGAAPGTPGQPGQPGAPTKTPSLDQFTIDLTEKARKGGIDPVLGRDPEIRQVIDILTRRRQNNPILTGEAGVGKTAVAEGFALRIVAGDVPPPLQGVTLRTLDLGLLQAGAGVKGEFENRLKSVIEEVKSSPTPIILFIDEAHTMVGAGGQAGQGDAANLLKPALARGELRTVAATTWAEYKKYFERDAALARRFQVVKVEEPTEASAIEMMRGLSATLEKHHGVRILDEAVRDSVRLSHRYLSGRQLPDKSVSLLDTACARVAIGYSATPSVIEDTRRRIEQLSVAIESLELEASAGADHRDALNDLKEKKKANEDNLAALEGRWKEEVRLVGEIRKLRERLEGPRTTKRGGKPAAPPKAAPGATPEKPPAPLTPEEREKASAELTKLSAELKKLQGEEPLLQVCVDAQAVAEVLSNWTGIPVGRMVADEINTVLTLKQQMEQRIIGQSHALEALAQTIRTARANLADPKRPIGVFLLVGTSGVGKTETAITLADLLYGGEQNMTVINMSEFKEEHKVSLLMGSPPGYVGYGEGGVMTEAVRRRPYSVLLLDEMEKAHSGVQDIFYQVFDKGNMRDGEGRDIDFKNTVILMTSNAGTDTIHKICADPETMPDAEGLAEALRPELLKVFKPAFLGRVTLVPFFPLSDDVMKQIIKLQLGRIVKRIQENYRAKMTYSPELIELIASRCKEVETGARNVAHILTRSLLPEMASEFLNRMAQGQTIASVNIGVNGSGGFKYEIA